MAQRAPNWSRRSETAASTVGGPKFVTALSHGLSILACFSAGQPRLGLRELARRSHLPLSTVKRLVHTLTQAGYLHHDESSGQLGLGSGVLAFAGAAVGPFDLRDFAAPLMQELAEETGVCVALGLRRRLNIVCIEVRHGASLVSLNMEVGTQLPLANSAIGRAYLAVCPEDERNALIDSMHDSIGDDACELRRTIDRSMATYELIGACSSFGEWQPDVNGVAVGLRPGFGLPPMSLTCGAPAAKASPEYMLHEVRPRLLEFVQRIEQGLGYGPRSAADSQ